MAGVRHAAARGLTLRAAVIAVAAQGGVSERTLWRWLARAQVEPSQAGWEPSKEDLIAYARWCANASAAWRERREAGADVPALRTFQEGIAAALTPGQRAGLRAGELARREYDAYLRWEPEARNDLWEADHKQLDVDVRAQGFERPVGTLPSRGGRGRLDAEAAAKHPRLPRQHHLPDGPRRATAGPVLPCP